MIGVGRVGLTLIIRHISVLNWTCTELVNWNWAWQFKFCTNPFCPKIFFLPKSSKNQIFLTQNLFGSIFLCSKYFLFIFFHPRRHNDYFFGFWYLGQVKNNSGLNRAKLSTSWNYQIDLTVQWRKQSAPISKIHQVTGKWIATIYLADQRTSIDCKMKKIPYS